jgi:hypothetical protein
MGHENPIGHHKMSMIFVDVEATGISPASGVMTEFGAVEYTSRETFHGVLFESKPSDDNPAIPVVTGRVFDIGIIMTQFDEWLTKVSKGRPTFVSDNPAYDFQWVNYYFDRYLGRNPFGYSGRRISDFWAGLNNDWSKTQSWKRFRVTPHDHNPVNDAMGNVEAFEVIMRDYARSKIN